MRENITNMLIRFVLNNILSFGVQKEFNLLPNARLKTLQKHIYSLGEASVLKLSAIYGANGAGKSNLIQGLEMLQHLILSESIPVKLKNGQFKFQQDKENTSQLLAIEFIQEDVVLYYGIEILNGIVVTEELYESGVGQKEDTLIFERKTDKNQNTYLQFSAQFEKSKKNQILKEILLKEFIKPNKPILKLIANRESKDLIHAKKAFTWFNEVLTIITPGAKPLALSQRMDMDYNFKTYADDIMEAFNVGVTGVFIQKEKIEDFFGSENEAEIQELMERVEEDARKMINFRTKNGHEVLLVKEANQIYVKNLQLEHKVANGQKAIFDMDEESDGTVRLLDFIPAFRDLIQKSNVYVIDEIERSLHPLLIKHLIKKFSDDPNTNGQLIFTTHESNLLDQDIFRQDEIWFAEKDNMGRTDLYALSAFKEHKTIDIQKGYLNGRYGSIPFLGNLEDLNWHNYATQK